MDPGTQATDWRIPSTIGVKETAVGDGVKETVSGVNETTVVVSGVKETASGVKETSVVVKETASGVKKASHVD